MAINYREMLTTENEFHEELKHHNIESREFLERCEGFATEKLKTYDHNGSLIDANSKSIAWMALEMTQANYKNKIAKNEPIDDDNAYLHVCFARNCETVIKNLLPKEIKALINKITRTKNEIKKVEADAAATAGLIKKLKELEKELNNHRNKEELDTTRPDCKPTPDKILEHKEIRSILLDCFKKLEISDHAKHHMVMLKKEPNTTNESIRNNPLTYNKSGRPYSISSIERRLKEAYDQIYKCLTKSKIDFDDLFTVLIQSNH